MPDTEDDAPRAGSSGNRAPLAFAAVVVVLLAALLFLGYRILDRLDGVERRVAISSVDSSEAADLARQALHRSADAEASARIAAENRIRAEAEAADARQQSEEAREAVRLCSNSRARSRRTEFRFF